MKLGRELTIYGTTLDRQQLEKYMQKQASLHDIINNCEKETYPIPYVKENFTFITKTYQLLNEHIKLGLTIHGAGIWLLDNYYIIEETVKAIFQELSLKKYTSQVGLAGEPYKGFSRVFVLASEMVAYTEGKIEEENLKQLMAAYQTKKILSMEEIWNIKTFLSIALVKNIYHICQVIYRSQMQKYKVESIVERLIEQKPKQEQKFKIQGKTEGSKTIYQMKYPFIEYMSYRLKQYGKKSYGFLNVLEEEVEKTRTNCVRSYSKRTF